MRYVLDTDVIVSAMRSPTGASAALLLAALDGLFVMVANVPLVVEYEATCSLPEHQLAGGLSKTEVGIFLAEKLTAMNTANFFTERKNRADFEAFRKILTREGGQPPHMSDELPT